MSQAVLQKPIPVCGVTTKRAPDITLEYEQEGDTLIRSARGKILERYDAHDDKGWHDWSQQDVPRRAITFVGGKDKTKIAPVGTAYFNRIAASRDCTECHTITKVKVTPESLTASLSAEILAKLGPLEAKMGARLGIGIQHNSGSRQSPKAGVCESPRRPVPAQPPKVNDGPQQTRPEVVQGPRGPAGPAGRDGIDADMNAIGQKLAQWLEANRAELQGHPGAPGIDGKPGKDGRDGDDGRQGPRGERGDSPILDYRDIAARVKNLLGTDSPDSGDILAAVHQVMKDNVGSFKGDPGTVTVVIKWSDGTPIGTFANLPSGSKVTQPLEKVITEPK